MTVKKVRREGVLLPHGEMSGFVKDIVEDRSVETEV
jgi:hypothetical protein